MGRSLPRVLSDDDARKLIDVFNTRYDSGVKNKAMVLLMLVGGLRVSEVCDLKRNHINVNAGRLKVVNGKGDKDRIVGFNGEAREMLKEWLDRRPESDGDWMFPTRTGNRTHTSSLRRMVKNYAKKAGVVDADEVSPHTLRHTCATRMLRQGVDLPTIQDHLGHEDIETTRIYLHVCNDHVVEAAQSITF